MPHLFHDLDLDVLDRLCVLWRTRATGVLVLPLGARGTRVQIRDGAPVDPGAYMLLNAAVGRGRTSFVEQAVRGAPQRRALVRFLVARGRHLSPRAEEQSHALRASSDGMGISGVTWIEPELDDLFLGDGWTPPEDLSAGARHQLRALIHLGCAVEAFSLGDELESLADVVSKAESEWEDDWDVRDTASDLDSHSEDPILQAATPVPRATRSRGDDGELAARHGGGTRSSYRGNASNDDFVVAAQVSAPPSDGLRGSFWI